MFFLFEWLSVSEANIPMLCGQYWWRIHNKVHCSDLCVHYYVDNDNRKVCHIARVSPLNGMYVLGEGRSDGPLDLREGRPDGPFDLREGQLDGQYVLREGQLDGPFDLREGQLDGPYALHDGQLDGPFDLREGQLDGPRVLREEQLDARTVCRTCRTARCMDRASYVQNS